MPEERREERAEPGGAGSFEDLVEAATAEAAAARRRPAELGDAQSRTAEPEPSEPERPEPETPVTPESQAAEHDRESTASAETGTRVEEEEERARPARRRRRFRPLLIAAWFLVVVACAATVAALSGAGEDGLPRTGAARDGGSRQGVSGACRGAWAAAAGTAPVDRTGADLDAAVQACRSPGEWLRAAHAFPRALDGTDALAHLRARCRASEALRGASLCQDLPE